MDTSIKLTVFFEEMFWIGVFERSSNGNYEVAKVTFGSEPKDSEIYEFILQNFSNLRFGNSVLKNKIDVSQSESINPKRLQRKIKKETKNIGIGTKAQIALKLQHEENKLERKHLTRADRELNKEKKFQLKQRKKLMKHRGH